MASSHGTVAHLLPPGFKTDITRWLDEDCPSLDYGGFVVGESIKEAQLLCKSSGVLAGVPFFDEVFRQLDCSVTWHFREGTQLEPIAHTATVRGSVRNILLGERVALNVLARCSGIATQSARTKIQLSSAMHAGATPPILAGTRKTTPGFRLVEKYGMLVGGADPHRHDLSAMIMLKDNHVWACGGSIPDAVRAAKAAGGFALKTDVECRTEAEAAEAIGAGADIVMLDNFSPEEAATAARSLRSRFPAQNFLLEISGGLTEANLAQYANAGVDILSTSSIHQGVGHVDFSLKIVH